MNLRSSLDVPRVLVGPAWRAAPGTLVWAFVATTVAAVASATFPLGFHLMVDGALGHDRSRVVTGVCVVAVLSFAGAVGAAIATSITDALLLICFAIVLYRPRKQSPGAPAATDSPESTRLPEPPERPDSAN